MAKKAFFENLGNVSSQLDKQKEIEGETIKKSLTILPELERLIPPLSNEEYEGLRSSIAKEKKVRDPLVVWKKGDQERILIDGHHRYKIIHATNVLEWNVVEMEFSDIQQVKMWMVSNQNSRRNFTPVGISFLRGNWYLDLKKDRGGDNRTSEGATSDLVGELFGVNRSTIHRDAKIASAINAFADESMRLILLGKECPYSKSQMEKLGAIHPEKIQACKSFNEVDTLLGLGKTSTGKKALLEKPTKTYFEEEANSIFSSIQKRKKEFMKEPSQKVIDLLKYEIDRLEALLEQ